MDFLQLRALKDGRPGQRGRRTLPESPSLSLEMSLGRPAREGVLSEDSVPQAGRGSHRLLRERRCVSPSLLASAPHGLGPRADTSPVSLARQTLFKKRTPAHERALPLKQSASRSETRRGARRANLTKPVTIPGAKKSHDVSRSVGFGRALDGALLGAVKRSIRMAAYQ